MTFSKDFLPLESAANCLRPASFLGLFVIFQKTLEAESPKKLFKIAQKSAIFDLFCHFWRFFDFLGGGPFFDLFFWQTFLEKKVGGGPFFLAKKNIFITMLQIEKNMRMLLKKVFTFNLKSGKDWKNHLHMEVNSCQFHLRSMSS